MVAPMPGLIIAYKMNVGDAVKKGDAVVVLEAMKMENALVAPCDGVIKAINYKSGDSVPKGAALCVIGSSAWSGESETAFLVSSPYSPTRREWKW